MIRLDREEGIWVATIDRPDKANALTPEMLQALDEAVVQAGQAGAQALILTGAGKGFSPGAGL